MTYCAQTASAKGGRACRLLPIMGLALRITGSGVGLASYGLSGGLNGALG